MLIPAKSQTMPAVISNVFFVTPYFMLALKIMNGKDTSFNGSSDRWIVFICKWRNKTGLSFCIKRIIEFTYLLSLISFLS